MKRPPVIVVAVACILVGGAAGAVVKAAAQSTNLAMNPGDTAHVTCAGPALSVANQTATALDLNCAPNPTTTTIAPTTTSVGSTTTTTPPPSVVSEDQVARGFNTSAVTVSVTNSAPEVVVAWVSADTNGPGQTVAVTGGGLTWILAGRANAQLGTGEVWWAISSGKNLAVTATPAQTGKNTQLTVITYLGASKIGAVKSASAPSGPPAVSLTPQVSGSLVGAVGFDWDNAVNRTVPAGQTLDVQNIDAAGDTYWTQHVNAATTAGQGVTVNDNAPTGDRWDLQAVEVLAASGPPPTTTTTAAGTTTTTSAGSTTTTTTGSSTAPSVDGSTPPPATIPNNVMSATSGSFSPPGGSVVYAAFSMDSLPGSGAAASTVTNSGTPLAWQLKGRENHTDGASVGGFVEVWWAANPTTQTAITVTGTFNVPSKNVTPPVGYLQVLVVGHAAANQASAAWMPTWNVNSGGAPSAALTTTASNSLVLGVFDNWDSSVNPTPGPNQTTTINGSAAVVLNPTDQDTYWLQSQTSPTPNAGTVVTMNDTAPSVRFHEIAWEVLAG